MILVFLLASPDSQPKLGGSLLLLGRYGSSGSLVIPPWLGEVRVPCYYSLVAFTDTMSKGEGDQYVPRWW